MRPGVSFPHRHPHEANHLRPLMRRLRDVTVAPPEEASAVVHADTRPPVRGAWNVLVFHGLGDKGYVGNPLFLQKGRHPRLRTALNMPLGMLRLPAPFLRPPSRPGRKPSRYEQLNAYGPRWVDLFEDLLTDVHVSRHGHLALNERGAMRPDPAGPLLWLPTWDNRTYLGGGDPGSLPLFWEEVVRVARRVPVLVKFHPHTVRRGQHPRIRARLAAAPGVSVLPPDADPYDLLPGCRGVLTDSSSLGFEAYCAGIPVAILQGERHRGRGLHAELADRTAVFTTARPDLAAWAHSPSPPRDARWARDLLYPPNPSRNDAFAAELRQRAVEHAR